LYFALKGAPQGLDPVRIQKGMFLFAQEGRPPASETYSFLPYSYGPMSSEIYADVDFLEANGMIYAEPVPGYTWKRYRATERGRETALALRDEANPAALRRLYEIKQEIATKAFNRLLRDVYADYPEYATRSVFTG
jgi:uncharacterized protein YwgA